jgi:hypothetical protein
MYVLPVAILENVWKLDKLLGIITELPTASFLNWKIHIRSPDALRRWSRGKMISNFEARRKSFYWRVPIRYAAVHGRLYWANANLKASKPAMWTHRLLKEKGLFFKRKIYLILSDSFCSLSYDRPTASSKASSPHIAT